jgi:hypothetical protein
MDMVRLGRFHRDRGVVLDLGYESGVRTFVLNSLAVDLSKVFAFGKVNLKFGLLEGIFGMLGSGVVGVSRRSGHCNCSRDADVPTGPVR